MYCVLALSAVGGWHPGFTAASVEDDVEWVGRGTDKDSTSVLHLRKYYVLDVGEGGFGREKKAVEGREVCARERDFDVGRGQKEE